MINLFSFIIFLYFYVLVFIIFLVGLNPFSLDMRNLLIFGLKVKYAVFLLAIGYSVFLTLTILYLLSFFGLI